MYGTSLAGHGPAPIGHNGGPMMMSDAALAMLGVTDAEVRTWAFFLNQVSKIESQVYEIQYPTVRYASLIPVDTSGPEWLQAVTYFSLDRAGAAQWFHANAQDVPLVGLTRNMFATSVQMAAIGYGYNEEELAVYNMAGGGNLTADKAAVARKAAEEFIDRVAFFGDANMGFQGLTNNSNVTSGLVANTGTGSSRLWSAKTADQILADVNSLLTGIYTGSSGVELADTLLLPQTAFITAVTTPRSPNSDTTVMEFIMRTNVYTMETGRPLTIRGVWGLDTLGAGNTGRMIAYRRDPGVLKLIMPMPFQFRQPWRRGPLMYEVPGIFRLGGLDIRRPAAVRYGDGIC